MMEKRRVSFNEDLNKTLTMVTWSFAYKNARKSPWEMYARDRTRFQDTRIERYKSFLNKILDPSHRLRIFEQRFM